MECARLGRSKLRTAQELQFVKARTSLRPRTGALRHRSAILARFVNGLGPSRAKREALSRLGPCSRRLAVCTFRVETSTVRFDTAWGLKKGNRSEALWPALLEPCGAFGYRHPRSWQFSHPKEAPQPAAAPHVLRFISLVLRHAAGPGL